MATLTVPIAKRPEPVPVAVINTISSMTYEYSPENTCIELLSTSPSMSLLCRRVAQIHVAPQDINKRVQLTSLIINGTSLRGTIAVTHAPEHPVTKTAADYVSVFARVSFDQWESYTDVPATLVMEEEHSAYFFFTTTMPDWATACMVAASCDWSTGKQEWDNRDGQNYVLSCEAATPISASSSTTSLASIPSFRYGSRPGRLHYSRSNPSVGAPPLNLVKVQ